MTRSVIKVAYVLTFGFICFIEYHLCKRAHNELARCYAAVFAVLQRHIDSKCSVNMYNLEYAENFESVEL